MPKQPEVFYCPECADYSEDREHRMNDEGFEIAPLCKHCGSECDDIANEPRMEEIAKMILEMNRLRMEYTTVVNKVQELTNEVRKDYKIVGELG